MKGTGEPSSVTTGSTQTAQPIICRGNVVAFRGALSTQEFTQKETDLTGGHMSPRSPFCSHLRWLCFLPRPSHISGHWHHNQINPFQPEGFPARAALGNRSNAWYQDSIGCGHCVLPLRRVWRAPPFSVKPCILTPNLEAEKRHSLSSRDS